MQISDNAAVSLNSTNAPSGAASRNEGSSFQDLLSQLNAYTGSNPGQGMFNEILGQLGITPQQLAQMTPAEREKILEKVRDLMKKEMQAQQQVQQQDPSVQLMQMQQQGLQAGLQSGTQSDTSSSSSSSHRHGAIDVAL
jgi:hypothetical protein